MLNISSEALKGDMAFKGDMAIAKLRKQYHHRVLKKRSLFLKKILGIVDKVVITSTQPHLTDESAMECPQVFPEFRLCEECIALEINTVLVAFLLAVAL